KRDLSFSDISFLREASGLPVVVKGLMNVEDVRQSLAAGASGIWVSNHGGRQMDGVSASISMLRAAADAVEGRAPVILDSGLWRNGRGAPRVRSDQHLQALGTARRDRVRP